MNRHPFQAPAPDLSEVIVAILDPLHLSDEQCDVDPETDSCRECGGYHGEPCLVCGGRGLHRRTCAVLATVPLEQA